MAFNKNRFIDLRKAVATEKPISRADAKAHCRIESTDEDTYVDFLIDAETDDLESEKNISLTQRQFTLIVDVKDTNEWIELFYGPVVSIDDVTNEDGEALAEGTGYQLRGVDFIEFKSHVCGLIIITYTAGYEVIPYQTKLDLLQRIALRYDKRRKI